jgi:hypothetical protein
MPLSAGVVAPDKLAEVGASSTPSLASAGRTAVAARIAWALRKAVTASWAAHIVVVASSASHTIVAVAVVATDR